MRKLRAEDVADFKSVSDPQLSSDGCRIAFVVSDAYTTDNGSSPDIWLVETSGGDPSQITSTPASNSTPRWSPDGEHLTYVSEPDEGSPQIWVIPAGMGKPAQLTSVDGRILAGRAANAVAWSPDGSKIAFLMREPETAEERKRKEEKDDAIEFEKFPKFTHLYSVDVVSGEVAQLSPAGLHVWEFAWSPNGRDFAVVASDLPFEHEWYTCRLATFSLDGGPVRTVHFSKRQVARPAWSPDGTRVAFITSNWSDRGLNHGSVYVVTREGQARDVTAGHIASVHSFAWTADNERIVTLAHERGGAGVAEIDVTTGERASIWHGPAALLEGTTALPMDADGNPVAVLEDATTPPDVVYGRRTPKGMDWTRLTEINPHAAEFAIGQTRELFWSGADQWEMQGLLILPPGADEESRYPLVTVVHGGPTGVSANKFYPASRNIQLLATEGIAVFLPNFRGSTGWGLDFAESNIGDMGGKDWEDIRRGIDHCIVEGYADPEKLGISGHSYGGFMAAWAVTQTDRFRAAVMSAGISDWRSFHGSSRIPDWDVIYYGNADPWDSDGIFRKFSPITYVDRVRTPTLILHGEQDKDVPVSQSYMFYRALSDYGCEAELVVYPRERHGIRERKHFVDSCNRTVDWFASRLVASPGRPS